MGMAEGFAHNVKIKEIRIGTEFGKQLRKVLYRQPTGCAAGAGTESAVEITKIGNFKIDFTKTHVGTTFHSIKYSIKP